MTVIVGLIFTSLLVALGFLAAFGWAVRTGQFDDTGTPPLRILADEGDESPAISATTNQKPTP
jgi:cbb3-type cytochrome oxidase maturation protein